MSSRKISLIRLGENSTSDERFFQGGLPDDADCCPSMETKRLYKWNGSVLQEYKNDGAVPTQASSKSLAEPPFYSVLTLNDSSDEKEVTTKRVL
ncbi:hypothetical protein JTM54_34485, partial [Pseudomonas aeruginosa]|nr:hypothetical protein [Pseudomonas aeruginosa]